MACASTGPNDHASWNHDLYSMMLEEISVLRTRGFAIIAPGDFNVKVGRIPGLEENTDTLNSNSNMFKSFVLNLHLLSSILFRYLMDSSLILRKGKESLIVRVFWTMA